MPVVGREPCHGVIRAREYVTELFPARGESGRICLKCHLPREQRTYGAWPGPHIRRAVLITLLRAILAAERRKRLRWQAAAARKTIEGQRLATCSMNYTRLPTLPLSGWLPIVKVGGVAILCPPVLV